MADATSLTPHRTPTEVITDRASALASVIKGLILAAFRGTGQYENNGWESDRGRFKAWCRLMRGLKTDRTVSIAPSGRALVKHLRRGHDELGVEVSPAFRLAAAFDEVQLVT